MQSNPAEMLAKLVSKGMLALHRARRSLIVQSPPATYIECFVFASLWFVCEASEVIVFGARWDTSPREEAPHRRHARITMHCLCHRRIAGMRGHLSYRQALCLRKSNSPTRLSIARSVIVMSWPSQPWSCCRDGVWASNVYGPRKVLATERATVHQRFDQLARKFSGMNHISDKLQAPLPHLADTVRGGAPPAFLERVGNMRACGCVLRALSEAFNGSPQPDVADTIVRVGAGVVWSFGARLSPPCNAG